MSIANEKNTGVLIGSLRGCVGKFLREPSRMERDKKLARSGKGFSYMSKLSDYFGLT